MCKRTVSLTTRTYASQSMKDQSNIRNQKFSNRFSIGILQTFLGISIGNQDVRYVYLKRKRERERKREKFI